MRWAKFLYVIPAVILFVSSHARADLIVNGGFETGAFTGWTQSGNTGATEVETTGFSGYDPNSGSYFAALGPVGLLGFLSQDVTTVTGQDYQLSYYLASNGTTPNEFETIIGGTTVFDQLNIPTQPYTQYTFDFQATSTATNVEFGFRNDPSFLALDDVSLNAVGPNAAPLPATAPVGAFLLVTFFAFVHFRNRKPQRA